MAKIQKIDAAAAKARKQKIILGVIVGVFVLLGVIQGPKLMKHGPSTPATAAPAETTATTPAATAGTPAATGTATAPGTVVSGISVPASTPADPTKGKLISFSLFESQDPFVPQVSDKASDASAPATTGASGLAASPDTGTATTPAAAPAASGGNAAPAAVPEQPPMIDATLVINGKPEYLQAKGTFPAADPVFELVTIKPKTVKIGVSGGAFTDGKLLVLKMDKPITLVNTATGARYKITLVYTGTAPEKVESFTAGSTTADTSGQASTSASTVDASAQSK